MNPLLVALLTLAGQADAKDTKFELPKIEPRSKELYVAVELTEHSKRFGISTNQLFDPINRKERKKLTRDPRGITNNTAFRVEGYEYLFGNAIPGLRWASEGGQLLKEVPVEGDRGWRSVMIDENHRVRFDQRIQIIPGEQTGLYDTVLIRYIIKNEDRTPHTVGLRFMLDTYVGATDGVPILVPGPKAELVETLMQLPQREVPPFLRMLESDQLDDPTAVVAELGLRLRGHETPEKVVLCRWPQNSEARWGNTGKLDDWKYEAMNANPKAKDSCIVVYWGELRMNPKSERTLGFTYGLGKLAGLKDGVEIAKSEAGQARLFVAGANLKKPFPVACYVKGDAKSIKLQLPDGLTLADGQKAEQEVPKASSAGYAVVLWEVKAAKAGEFAVKAEVAGIGAAAEKVRVHEKSLFEE